MLSETFIASSSSPPQATAANSTLLKDAGIFIHAYQPLSALRTTFKKSLTFANCLAVSTSHIFAAQAGKAIIHVYNREKGKQESIVSFPERISSIVLAAEDTVLVVGTEEGSVILWELCTGRQVSTPASHLQAITILVVDVRSNFLLSGSLDSVIHVWSLLDLLSFHPANRSFQNDPRIPRLTFSGHRSAISSLVLGHSGSFLNFAVSASRDNTAIVWNFHTGELLRTFLLPATPLCLVLDPADRAFYVGYEDGSVHIVDFFASQVGPPRNTHDMTLAETPIQPSPSTLMSYTTPDIGSACCITVSYDGTIVLTGHSSGNVVAWEVGSRRFISKVADFNAAPITNLLFLPPTGFPDLELPRVVVENVVKPRPFDKSASTNGQIPESYALTARFPASLNAAGSYLESGEPSEFEAALEHPSFPTSLLFEGIAELAGRDLVSSDYIAQSGVASGADDFMHLDGTVEDREMAEVQQLREQVAHLKKLQETSFTQIGDLDRERRELRKEIEEVRRSRIEKIRRVEARAEREWAALGNGQPVEPLSDDCVGDEVARPGSSSQEDTSGSE